MYRISEKAITIAWEEKIDLDIHRQVMQMDASIIADPFIGWIENVPAYHTLTIFYDPLVIHRRLQVDDSFNYVEQAIEKYFQLPQPVSTSDIEILKVPVCYDLSFGIDLTELSHTLGLDIEEIVRLHTSKKYHVFMLGFLPGFPYMGVLPDALTVPRKHIPSLKVPAGTVAIASQQTGIYPVDSPGGWHAIGRTPVSLFKEGKAYFEPGDIVEFYSISLQEFDQLKKA